jgi:hypothetical protein
MDRRSSLIRVVTVRYAVSDRIDPSGSTAASGSVCFRGSDAGLRGFARRDWFFDGDH